VLDSPACRSCLPTNPANSRQSLETRHPPGIKRLGLLRRPLRLFMLLRLHVLDGYFHPFSAGSHFRSVVCPGWRGARICVHRTNNFYGRVGSSALGHFPLLCMVSCEAPCVKNSATKTGDKCLWNTRSSTTSYVIWPWRAGHWPGDTGLYQAHGSGRFDHAQGARRRSVRVREWIRSRGMWRKSDFDVSICALLVWRQERGCGLSGHDSSIRCWVIRHGPRTARVLR